MKSNATKKLRQKLAADQPVYGLWVTLESASITEMAVALGLDWVLIDAEHGHLDLREIVNHVRAAVRSDTVVFVRIAELNVAMIKRVLDIGADGVVLPWMETPEQVADAVRFSHYPPEGMRGIGAERATCWGRCMTEAVSDADQNVMIVPIIESVRGAKNIEQLVKIEGTELFFIGPADFSSTAGYPGQWEGPGVAEQILHVKDVVRGAGKHVGLIATSNENMAQRREQGFRAIGIGIDGALLLRSITGALASLGKGVNMNPRFTLESQPAAPMERPPESFRPDRPEVMNPVGSGKVSQIARGVSFEALVGAHNRARNLTTGIATFSPDAQLPYHNHPFSEAVTLMSGRATIEIEGRRYHLNVMDNAVIPKGLAHCVTNTSSVEPAVFNVMMASHEPSRTLIERFYSKKAMPEDSTGQPGVPGVPGVPGGERINRFATAPRFEAGPNTQFIDFFNKKLIPGIEMSGGYGLFKPGGRLPAHIHDFDESICIIEGTATCNVEGRLYQMSNGSTALQPRGRVHYFINNSRETMVMLWVYAGPLPERLVVEERCATVEGNPWK